MAALTRCLSPGHFDHIAGLSLPLWSDTRCTGEFDDELLRLDQDPHDMILDEEGVRDLGGYVEVISNNLDDEALFRTCPPASCACLKVRNRGVAHPRSRASHNRITLHPEYGRLVTAFCGTFWPAVADQGLIQGAAPRSSSAIMRAETSS
jgi:hypothetical protein